MLADAATASDCHPMPLPIAVLVVDDQLAVREGVSRLIACALPALRVVVTAATGTEALRLAAQWRPELVVLDADLAGEDGLALIPLLAPATVLVLSCHGDRATRERAARLGARAFLEKHQPAVELLDAISRLATPRMRGEQTPALAGEGAYASRVASSVVPAAGLS